MTKNIDGGSERFKESFKLLVFAIKTIYFEKKIPKIVELLSSKDEHDKTNVFDYVDDNWFEYVCSNMENVLFNKWYRGDGTIEHRIAYIVVNINLLHGLPNGNKRTSILVLLCLLLSLLSDIGEGDMDLIKKISEKEKELYNLVKQIARDGAEKKDENIEMFREYIKANFRE